MSLLEALETPPSTAATTRKVDAILLSLPHDETTALQKALSSAEWPHQQLADVLTASGHPVSEASIRRYRKATLGWTR